MFTFTKTVTSEMAYVVEWGTGNRQDGIAPRIDLFETLKEAQDFCKSNKQLYSAKIYRKIYIEDFKQGQQYDDIRGFSAV